MFLTGSDSGPIAAAIGVEVLVVRKTTECYVILFFALLNHPLLRFVLVAAVLGDNSRRVAVGRARKDMPMGHAGEIEWSAFTHAQVNVDEFGMQVTSKPDSLQDWNVTQSRLIKKSMKPTEGILIIKLKLKLRVLVYPGSTKVV